MDNKDYKGIPVYPHSIAYATEHNERSACFASLQANVACKNAIEDAIDQHYDGYSLGSEAAKQVLEQFGPDRTLYVLANTIQHRGQDGRVSRGNVEWANTVPILEGKDAFGNDMSLSFSAGNCHAGLLNSFTTTARKECEPKQSIRAQLTVKPEQRRHREVKSHEMEAR